MTTTKKGFLKAGSILAIIAAVSMALMSILFVSAASIITEDFIIDTYTSEPGYMLYEEADGSYYIEYFEDEDDLLPTIVEDEEIQLIATLSKTVLIVLSVFVLGLGIAQLVFGILILNKLSKDKSSKKQIITLLVLSILTGSIITAAFMIVALCLKDKKQPTLENINEIAAEQQSLEQNKIEETKDEQRK